MGTGGALEPGDVAFVERFGEGLGARARDIAIDEDGNVYVVGFFTETITFDKTLTTDPGSVDMFLVKVDSTGTPLWSHQFNHANSAQTITDDDLWGSVAIRGGLLAVGGPLIGETHVDPQNPSNMALTQTGVDPELFVALLTPDGDLTAAIPIGENSTGAVLRDLTIDQTDHVFGIGEMVSLDLPLLSAQELGQSGVFAFRMHDDTTIEFGKALVSSAPTAEGRAIAMSPNQRLAIAGSFTTDLDNGEAAVTGSGTRNGFVAVLSQDGDWRELIALKPANADDPAEVHAVDWDSTNSLLIGGVNTGPTDFGNSATLSATASTGFVAKLDVQLGGIWAQELPSDGSSVVYGVAAGPGDGVDVVGTFDGSSLDIGSASASGDDDADIFYARLDPSGGHLGHHVLSGVGDAAGQAVATNGAGAVGFCGFMLGALTGEGVDLQSTGTVAGEEDAVIGLISP